MEPYAFDIAACTHCRTSYILLDGYDTTPLYEAIYRHGAVLPGYARYFRYADEVTKNHQPLDWLANQELIYWAIRERLRNTARHAGAEIMEVGSGLGYLTYSLNQHGFSVVGMDISMSAVNRAKKAFGDSLFVCSDIAKFAAESHKRYNSIIMTEVIEHVPNPIDFIEDALALLVPDEN